jgi:hypothetical protein
MSLEDQCLREAASYAIKHPRRVVSENCTNYPTLHWLFRYAKQVHAIRPKAGGFAYQGKQYAIVWQGLRMCVMHVATGIVLVGAAGVSDESKKPHP